MKAHSGYLAPLDCDDPMFRTPDLFGSISDAALDTSNIKSLTTKQYELRRMRDFIEDCLESRYGVKVELAIASSWMIRPAPHYLPTDDIEVIEAYMQECAQDYMRKVG